MNRHGNDRPLRIGIDATLAGIRESERGGVYQYLSQILTHGLSQSDHVDWKLLFALPHPRHSNTIKAFVSALNSPNVTAYRGWVPMRILRHLPVPVEFFAGKLDIFHSPAHLRLPSFCPSIVTIHDLAYLHDRGGETPHPELNEKERAHWHTRRRFFDEISAQTERSVMQAACVITVSESTRQALLQNFNLPPDKVCTIPLGVRDVCKHMPSADQSARVLIQYGLSQPYLLYVGGLDPNKNLVNLIEGFAIYRKKGGKSRLVIAGQSTFYRTVLERLVTQIGIQEDCSFLGFVPDAALPVLYRSAQSVLMPSPLEGFGLPALEAMACGTSVIAANAGALPEVVGDAALLVDHDSASAFSDAMMMLQEDQELRTRLSESGIRQASKFDWRQTARKTLSLYAQVAGRSADTLLSQTAEPV